ncbi:MAG: hypothetical protein IJC78_03825 [Clostridia bacterium]|nr:hypothetical protein [Clostridia bacterium]
MMHRYSVVYFDMNHVDEMVEDIVRQYDEGIADMVIFGMPLVPEGNPPADKASILCEQFDIYREKLAARGKKCGILIQCSIGHGYVLSGRFPFQHIINIEDGVERPIVCPYDEDFREYFKGVTAKLASHKPATIMLDDDFRLLHRDGHGCACPKHMAEFNRRAGTNLTREQLWEHMKAEDPVSKKYQEIFIETQKDALIGAAKAYRAGIDSVDPSIPGSYCNAGGEFNYEIAQIMSGEGHPVVLRINNSNYCHKGTHYFTGRMLDGALQMNRAKDHVDVLLAETDTCPHLRYSTAATMLHSHFTGSILEGAMGAKHWITCTLEYTPKTDAAYRKKLSKFDKFYRALFDIVPGVTPFGCRIPLPSETFRNFNRSPYDQQYSAWTTHVLERLGLPLYFGNEKGGVVFMDGVMDAQFTDAEIKEFLSGYMVLSSESAQRLIARGFGKYLGVDVKPWTLKPVFAEKDTKTFRKYRSQQEKMELVPTSEKTEAVSTLYYSPNRKDLEALCPGGTMFENELGGRILVYAGVPRAEFHYGTAFGFLTEERKNQFIRLLSPSGQLPVYFPGDEEVYLRAGNYKDGRYFCALFNIGLDPLEDITLITDREITEVTILSEDGTEKALPFTWKDGVLTVEQIVLTMDPAILFLK